MACTQEHLAVFDEMKVPSVDESENGGNRNDISRPSSAALNTQAWSSSNPTRSKKSASVSESETLQSLIGERIATSCQEDKLYSIGKNVASKLSKMTQDMEVIGEKVIHDVSHEGMTGMLKPTTKLISSEPVLSVLNYQFQHLKSSFPILQSQGINSTAPTSISIPETPSGENEQVLSPYSNLWTSKAVFYHNYSMKS